MRALISLFSAVLVFSCSFAPSEGGSLSRNAGASGGGAGSASPPSARPEEEEPAPSLAVHDGGYWLQLSADDSTSMASAQLARLGASTGLHRHEFINYYDPAPELFDAEPWGRQLELTQDVRLGASLVLSSGQDGGAVAELLLQLRAEPVEPTTRRPWHLVYCVDVSGSMAGDKMEFTRDALVRSLAHLRAGDHVTIVAFATEADQRISWASWPQDEAAIRSAIATLQPTGGTNMIAGLNLAYDLAAQRQTATMLSRVLLFGDGNANVGDVDIARFSALTRHGNDEGIYLSSVGVGTDFDWARMDQLADSGKGASVFLPDAREVSRMFGGDFYKLVEVSADAVEVELVLNQGFQLIDFSGEETSTDPNARVPSTILASGDDLTILARFSVTPEALASPFSMRVSFKPLGTNQLVTEDVHLAAAQELVATGGALYTRTRLVDDYARALTTGGDLAAVKAALVTPAASDPGLAEIVSLLP